MSLWKCLLVGSRLLSDEMLESASLPVLETIRLCGDERLSKEDANYSKKRTTCTS